MVISLLAEYIPYIQEKIKSNWLSPDNSQAGLSCEMKIRMIPGGDIVGIKVINSSGDPLFDRSVETAALRASPLPIPADPELAKESIAW